MNGISKQQGTNLGLMKYHAFKTIKFIMKSVISIGVARILSAGVHFFTTQQKLLKLTLALAGGCT